MVQRASDDVIPEASTTDYMSLVILLKSLQERTDLHGVKTAFRELKPLAIRTLQSQGYSRAQCLRILLELASPHI